MSAQRIGRLRALANDPAATDAERVLAREHIARVMGAPHRDSTSDDDYTEVGDELVAAMDRAMSRIVGMRPGRFRDSRVRAAQHRLGRDATKAWLDSRGQPLPRGRR